MPSILVLCTWEQGLHVVLLDWQQDTPLALLETRYVTCQASALVLNIARVVRPCLRPRIQSICGDGPDSHLRRGSGLVRVRV
jgi:hypothetical protein